MNIRDSHLIAQSINDINAKRAERSEAAAGFIVVFVVGVLGGLALIHFATPCLRGIC